MERTEYKRYSRDRAGQKQRKTRRHIQARTRRNASTIGGAAPDDPILTPLTPLTPLGHPAADPRERVPSHARYR